MRQNGSLSIGAVLGGALAVAAAMYYYLHLRRFSAVVRRAAFDIGSGYTKMLVADVKDGAIVGRVVLETEVKLSYKVDAQQSADGSLSEAIQAEGLASFGDLTAKALSLGATEATGIATEIFRKAPNGDAFLQRLTNATGVRITRISQEAEARLGLATAEALGGPSEAYAAAWDSGGASFQITGRQGPQSAPIASVAVRAFTATLGTGPAFERLLVQVQGRPYDVRATPNPVSATEAEALVRALQAELDPPVAWLRGATVVATGGWNSLWPVALRALGRSPSPVAEPGGEEIFPEPGSLTLDEARRALRAACERRDDDADGFLRDVAGRNVGAESASFVVPKLALLVAVQAHLGIARVDFRPATGGCAGLMALGEFVALRAT